MSDVSDVIKQHHLEAGILYPDYRNLIDGLLFQGKTTGVRQSESYTEYTKLNAHRMRRLDKTIKLRPEVIAQLERVSQPWIWLVLTEGWCGDAAQSVPVMTKMAEVSSNIQLRLLLRDEHLDVMDAYLTNGTRSIPKLICLNDQLQTLGTWGPRPEAAQQLFNEFKEKYGDRFRDHYAEWSEQLQLWYTRDRTQAIQQELMAKVKEWVQT